MKCLAMKFLSIKYPIYEMSFLSMKFPIYEMSFLRNFLSMTCPIYEMSVYELSKRPKYSIIPGYMRYHFFFLLAYANTNSGM